MKNHPQDLALRTLLRESWKVEIEPSPNFRAQVWTRIDALQRQPQTWLAWVRLHFLGVGMASAASLAAAITFAGTFAQNQTQHDREKLVSRYLVSIDPHARVGVAFASYTP